MKNFERLLASLSAAALMTAMALSFNACTEQTPFDAGQIVSGQVTATDVASQPVLEDGPLSREELDGITAPKEKIQIADKDFKALKSINRVSLQKRFVTSWLVHLGASGWAYAGDAEHGRCWLYFPANALNQTTIVTIDWESTGFLEGGAEFSPHGTQFNAPVTVWISYKDADLGGINEEDLRLWYFHEDTGMWELIGDVVDTENKMVGGLLNHFSRYAIGTE